MQNALKIILDSEILKKEDFSILDGMEQELSDSFNKGQLFRTATEMSISVLTDTKFPTPDAKYWQAVKEQNVMFENLANLSYEFRKNQVNIKSLARQVENKNEDPLKKEMAQIEMEQAIFRSKCQEREAKDRIREIKLWHEIKEKLKPELKYGIDNCNDHQLESYTKRWIGQAKHLEGASFGERTNLLSQLESGVKKCIEKKISLPKNKLKLLK